MESCSYEGRVGHARFGPVDHQFGYSLYMGMDTDYLWTLNSPGEHVRVSIESRRADTTVFRAGMALKRRDLTGYRLNTTLLKYPMMAGKIVAAIYFQALRLWWKKCPLYLHPHKHSKSRQQALDRAT